MKHFLTKYSFFIIVLSLFFSSALRHDALCAMDDISRELEYTEALLKDASAKGDIKQFETIHRTLANLAATSEALESPREKILSYLSISYFYVRMCDALPLLQLSKSTNPTGFNIDCVKQSEKYFGLAAKSAEATGTRDSADTYFYIGLGYDSMRGYLSKIGTRGTSAIYKKAVDNIQKAVTLGASFEGAKTVLARLNAQKPDSKTPVLSPETFVILHRSFYMAKALTPPSTLDYLRPDKSDPVASDPVNTHLDYRWRFHIKKPDDSWQFATGTAKTSFRLTVSQTAAKNATRPPLSLVAQELSPEDSAKAIQALVARSTQLLTKAGYTVDSQSETDFKGFPAVEVILTSEYKDIGVKTGTDKNTASPLSTKLYMFVVIANGIQYVISFNTVADNYARVFPDMKIIANTFTPF